MRGQVFTLDAVIALFLLFTALYVVSFTSFEAASLTSRDLLLRRWEAAAENAIATLHLADGPWACRVGGIRVPGCVRSGSYSSQKERFFSLDLNCYVEGDPSIQTLMGCDDPPVNPLVSYTREFRTCVGSPGNCVVKTLRLTIWKGQ